MVPYLIKTGSVVRVSQLAQFNLPGFVCISVTKRGHILLSKSSWFKPYAVTTVQRILLFKVTKFQRDQQEESNVLHEKALFLFIEITERSFLKYLAKTGIKIPCQK